MDVALCLHMTRNHVQTVKPATVWEVYAVADWFISRCIPVHAQRDVLNQYCDEMSIPRPWSGRLADGETEQSIVGKRIAVTFLTDDGCGERTYEDVGVVAAVLPFRGLHTVFRDGPLVVNDEDEWRVVEEESA